MGINQKQMVIIKDKWWDGFLYGGAFMTLVIMAVAIINKVVR